MRVYLFFAVLLWAGLVEAGNPYNGVRRSIPGRVELEHFDLGGQDVAYFDGTIGNSGGINKLRPYEDVDVNRYGIIVSVNTGEWLEYSVTISRTGFYRVVVKSSSLTYSSNQNGLTLLLDGRRIGNTINLASTGGDQLQGYHNGGHVYLPGGQHTLRIQLKGSSFNPDWIEFTYDNPPTISLTAPAAPVSQADTSPLALAASPADPEGILRVEFRANGKLIGYSTAAPYQTQWATPAAGSYAVTATAVDSAGQKTVSAAVPVTITGAPSVFIERPFDNAKISMGTTLQVRATASDPAGGINYVKFFDGYNNYLGTDYTAPYELSWQPLLYGTNTIVAQAVDSSGLTATDSVDVDLIFLDGFEDPACQQDHDSDRLWDCDESYYYGTDPADPDTDDDGLIDGDEVLGTASGLQLDLLGANPRHKDMLVEFDWTDDASQTCDDQFIQHTHRPTAGMIARVVTLFANLPISNPDGVPGIKLIADYGQGGAFTGGNYFPHPNGILSGDIFDAELGNIQMSNFAANRKGFFRWVGMMHRYGTSASSGQMAYPGSSRQGIGIVTLACPTASDFTPRTIAHEIGHSLGLYHGGTSYCNNRPNYPSVMNYRYQWGSDENCDLWPENTPTSLAFSLGLRPPLNEYALNEANGVCGANTTAIDWNGNGIIESSVAMDTSGLRAYSVPYDACTVLESEVTDSNDVTAILGAWLGGRTKSNAAQSTSKFMPEIFLECAPPNR